MLTLPCSREIHGLCSGSIRTRGERGLLDTLLRRPAPVYEVPCRCGCHAHPSWSLGAA